MFGFSRHGKDYPGVLLIDEGESIHTDDISFKLQFSKTNEICEVPDQGA